MTADREIAALLVSACSFITVTCTVLAVRAGLSRWQDPVRRRLLALSRKAGEQDPKTLFHPSSLQQLLQRSTDRIAAAMGIPPPARAFLLGSTRQRLGLAAVLAAAAFGTPACFQAAARFLGIRAIPLPLQIALTGIGMRLAVGFWARWQQRVRLDRIKQGLTDVLDLWTLCLGAGMSFQGALIRVIEEPGIVHPVFRKELIRTNEEIQAGCPREEALRHLARRCGDTSDMRALAAHITQAERLGTSLLQTLRAYAESLRFNRRQDMKETIQKLPVKLAFPLVFFILPALFVVLLGPAAIQLSALFSGR